jgi:hypothetical protein
MMKHQIAQMLTGDYRDDVHRRPRRFVNATGLYKRPFPARPLSRLM